jgi:hypothetical protein
MANKWRVNHVREGIVFMSIFSFLFAGCKEKPDKKATQLQAGSSPSAHLEKLPEITSESEEGFHDLVFYIQDFKRFEDGTQMVRASGTYKGRKVGLDIILGAHWVSGSIGKAVPLITYRGSASYRSIGSESDAFLKILDELYGTKLNPKSIKGETQFTGISLGGDPRDLAKGPVKIKLFYESGSDSSYAELYTNIELAKSKLEIREKDPDYRSPIVRALTSD